MTKSILATVIVIIGIVIAGYFFMRQKPQLDLSPSPSPSPSASIAPTVTATSSPVITMDITKLEAEILVEGTGNGAKAGDKLTVLYKGTLIDGRVFDASDLHGNTPFTLTLGAGQVIKGWDTGLVGMKQGEKRRLFIPSELAYGANAIPGTIIAANSDLIFEVELVKLEAKK